MWTPSSRHCASFVSTIIRDGPCSLGSPAVYRAVLPRCESTSYPDSVNDYVRVRCDDKGRRKAAYFPCEAVGDARCNAPICFVYGDLSSDCPSYSDTVMLSQRTLNRLSGFVERGEQTSRSRSPMRWDLACGVQVGRGVGKTTWPVELHRVYALQQVVLAAHRLFLGPSVRIACQNSL